MTCTSVCQHWIPTRVFLLEIASTCCRLMLGIVLKPCQQNLTDLPYLCSSAHSYRYQFAVNTKPFSTASHRWEKLLWPLIRPHFYTGGKTGSHWTGCGKGACVHVNTPEASNGITTFIFSPTCITLVSPFLSSHLDTQAACPQSYLLCLSPVVAPTASFSLILLSQRSLQTHTSIYNSSALIE